MTLFGLDISEHQRGIDLPTAAREGIDFCLIRACDGDYADPLCTQFLSQAKRAGLTVGAYWFLRAPSEGSTLAAQAAVVERQLARHPEAAVWLDVESLDSRGKPTLCDVDVVAAAGELRDRGLQVGGAYCSPAYWARMAGNNRAIAAECGALWLAHHGKNPAGGPREAYPGDSAAPWSLHLGGLRASLWQFTSRAQIAGYTVDANAFRGNTGDLQRLFRGE